MKYYLGNIPEKCQELCPAGFQSGVMIWLQCINKLWKSELNLAVKLGFTGQSAAHIPRENGGTYERNAEV